MSEAKFDPTRRLCPDGSCIGVIGADGRCGECGRTAGAAPAAAENQDASAVPGPGWNEEPDTGQEAEAAPTGDFDPKRRLCDDGSCVGIVGGDGRCGVCGLKAA